MAMKVETVVGTGQRFEMLGTRIENKFYNVEFVLVFGNCGGTG